MRQEQQYYVEIVKYESDEHGDEGLVEKRGPFNGWKANKVDDGLNINLNHERYYTRIVKTD